MNYPIVYVPKAKRAYRQKAKRIIFWQMVVLSIVLNLHLAHQIYNVRCQVNGKVVGWFVKAEVCGDMAQAKSDQQELARVQFLEANQDILK